MDLSGEIATEKKKKKKREWGYQIIQGRLGLSKECRVPFQVPEER